MRIYFDTEFTGLHQNTTLISIGLITDTGETFYAEFDDYDKSQCDRWINENVINNLILGDETKAESNRIKGNTQHIKKCLLKWLSKFDEIEFWSDCLSYDWVLLNGLIANHTNGYPQLPSNINYIPFDICTLFKIKGINPDISREQFIGQNNNDKKHNALYDAEVIKKCYELLI